MNKIIFLDIDGVMVTPKHIVKSQKHPGMEFDPRCVESLKWLLERTGARLVITSTWRKGYSVSGLKDLFNCYGLGKYVVNKTPEIPDEIRGKEIERYIRITQNSRHKVDKFIIIDDNADMGELLPHLVQTKDYKGITKAIAQEALNRLQGED